MNRNAIYSLFVCQQIIPWYIYRILFYITEFYAPQNFILLYIYRILLYNQQTYYLQYYRKMEICIFRNRGAIFLDSSKLIETRLRYIYLYQTSSFQPTNRPFAFFIFWTHTHAFNGLFGISFEIRDRHLNPCISLPVVNICETLTLL